MESEGEGAMNPRRWKKDECRERDSQQENYAANRELMPTFNFIARGIRTSYLERCCCYYMMMRCTCTRPAAGLQLHLNLSVVVQL